MVHETAIVSKEAKLGKNVKVGAFAIIDGDVEIGDNCEIAPRVHLLDGVRMGAGNYIGEGTLIGDKAQDLKFKGGRSFVKIGDNNTIREYVTIHRSNTEGKETVIGSDNFIMTMAHIAHDCVIGNNIIIVNWAGLTGHIEVHDNAFISGLTAIHQHVRIGKHSIIAGGIKVSQDIVPYTLVGGYPARSIGLNKVGLKRSGFDAKKIKLLSDAYRIIFRSKTTLKEALAEVEKSVEQVEEVKYFVEFIKGSKRGITR